MAGKTPLLLAAVLFGIGAVGLAGTMPRGEPGAPVGAVARVVQPSLVPSPTFAAGEVADLAVAAVADAEPTAAATERVVDLPERAPIEPTATPAPVPTPEPRRPVIAAAVAADAEHDGPTVLPTNAAHVAMVSNDSEPALESDNAPVGENDGEAPPGHPGEPAVRHDSAPAVENGAAVASKDEGEPVAAVDSGGSDGSPGRGDSPESRESVPDSVTE